MRRYLVVANQTLGGPELAGKIDECVTAGPCRFYFVVPATSVSDMEAVNRPLTWSGVDGGGAGMLRHMDEIARVMALGRLEKELARLREASVDADGEVGDPRPLHAIKNALRKQEVDEVIVSTLHRGSRWMVIDLPHRVKRNFAMPVTHVAGHPGPAA